MADTTTASLTELQAINRMLAAIGQSPITQDGLTNAANPDVAIAQETLYEVSRQIQSEGWAFNKEYNVIFSPNTSGKIEILPVLGIMQIDASEFNYRGNPSRSQYYQTSTSGAVTNANMDLIIKNNFLYDKRNKTDIFQQPVQCTVIYYRVFTACPPAIQYYIVDAAAARLCQRIIGDPQMYQMLQQRTEEARTYALQYETEQGDYSFFGSPVGGQYYVPYEPFDTLRRGWN
tara:strand:+ start:780 stop:1475 length:696 start_codon:yes stop_codon:yes gene_type:complete